MTGRVLTRITAHILIATTITAVSESQNWPVIDSSILEHSADQRATFPIITTASSTTAPRSGVHTGRHAHPVYQSTWWAGSGTLDHGYRWQAPATTDGAELEACGPDVSPDGHHVVFYNHQNTPKPTSIFSMNLDGTGVTRLTSSGHMDTLPVYSPDGTRILYIRDRSSPGSFDTFIMNSDGSHKRRLIIGAFVPNWGTKPVD